MSNELASTIISDVLVYGLYGAAAMLVVTMARFGMLLNRHDEAARRKARERREWEQTPEGEAAVRAEVLEMEKAGHRAELERDWPQTTIQELP